MIKHKPLYDVERDGELKIGETLILYEDGTTKKIIPSNEKGNDKVK